MKRVALLLGTAAAVLLLVGGAAQGRPAGGDRVEVVVTLARAPVGARSLASAAAIRVERAQAAFERRLRAAIPAATVRWHYRKVLDGLAIVLPSGDLPRLRGLPGVQELYPSVRYQTRMYSTPAILGAPQLWGPQLSTAGQGIKIGIIDDGVDQAHPFFSANGFTMPPGYPKGQTAYTTAKVIVARAFPAPGQTGKYADAPYDPESSFHATHVAGIAAGDSGTTAAVGGRTYTGLSGIAPRAYIGNYKALTVSTPDFGLDGNSPEIAAAIEAAVTDGMNVINLSLGEPEVTPSRDLVVRALEGAAAAGVVPVVAAGNDFGQFGRGSVGSPGNAPSAITVAAATKSGVIAGFSSSGPTPVSLEMKPDVTAPGAAILSSVPPADGTWAFYDGTSMATPQVSGSAALLRQRHPSWSVEQIKSALVQTALPAYTDTTRRVEAPTTREGGGFVDLPRADAPLLFADPTGLSLGLVRPGSAPVARTVSLTDAGGGAGDWTASVVEQQAHDPAVTVSVPPTVTVPGSLDVSAAVQTGALEADHTGFVVLTRGTDTRRIPFWFRVEVPKLGPPTATLSRTGTYQGNTRLGRANVSSYRYPDDPNGSGIPSVLAGPEQVFRVRITKPVANFGVAVLGSTKVEPRVVVAGDENRLTGYAGLPLYLNPYTSSFGRRENVAGAVLPAPGTYDVVFDEPSTAQAGPFTFRFWIDDTKPPALKLVSRTVPSGGRLAITATDAGAGIDPGTIVVQVDGAKAPAHLKDGTLRVTIGKRAPGRHRLEVTVSDYQEAKNMEDVARILPNTATLQTTFVVRAG